VSRALRRRLYSILFVVGMGFLVRETCVKEARTHATIEIDLGSRAKTAARVDATLLAGGIELADFHREALPDHTIGRCKFEVALPAEDDDTANAELHIAIDGKQLVRTIHAVEGGTLLVKTE
jgi:hypothetical protein